MKKLSQYLKEEDLKHIWHPCMQMKDYERLPLVPIKNAKGVYLRDFEENEYIDCISSWWVNLFGHSNDYINSSLKNQVENLEHVILTSFTHEPIINLSRRLTNITPKGLEKVFFADNGSSAIEVALKMSYQYNKNTGKNKEFFVSLENSYHGETMGALSVSDVGLYKEVFEPILLKPLHVKVPKTQKDEDVQAAIEDLKRVFEEKKEQISAFIIEPLVQCAGSMNMYSPLYIKKARALCDEYNVHLIADEIAVGFGRTGYMFGCDSVGVVPDFMALSKGLTGGYLPLSCVLTHEFIYDAFYDDYSSNKAFLHSHSYTGNPLACSVANATLDIFENENILEKNKILSSQMQKNLHVIKDENPITRNHRITGMICAFDIDFKAYPYEKRVGLKIFEYALKKGIYVRPLGNTVYLMPPYVITCKEIDRAMGVINDALKTL